MKQKEEENYALIQEKSQDLEQKKLGFKQEKSRSSEIPDDVSKNKIIMLREVEPVNKL